MKHFIATMALIALVGCQPHSEDAEISIPFAGVNGGLTNKQVEKNISKPLRKSSEKILKKLDKSETENGEWELSRLSVGLFLVFESELTNIYKVEVEPSVELRYQKL